MKIKEIKRTPQHITNIGGQALIEGILMRGPKDIAIAIRKPDGEIVLDTQRLNTLGMKYGIFRLPFIRGTVNLVESMAFGIKALMYSAEFFEEDKKNEDSVSDGSLLDKVFKDKKEEVEIVLTLAASLLITIILFVLLPNFIANFFKRSIDNSLILNLFEGLIRIGIFLIYILIVSKIEDIGRVFEYHGAEHKTIHCYENGDPLTVDNVKKYSILHPRCGTSFLFMVMIVSILVLSFFGWPNPVQRILIRLVLLPVIAGITYEINKLIGRSDSITAYLLSYPGLLIQRLATVKEPDESQMEVAIDALKAVLTGKKEDDLWK